MNAIKDIGVHSTHKFQKIMSNKYVQGEPYVTKELKITNKYINIPKISSVSNFQNKTSIFDKLAFFSENGIIMDLPLYKDKFVKSISDEIYKSVSKRHGVLKKDMFAFVYDTEFIRPINKDVITLFSNIFKKNIILIFNKDFHTYTSDYDTTMVIGVDTIYIEDSFECALFNLQTKGLFQYHDLNNMKITELKEYAKTYNIDITNAKKKCDIIKLLQDIKN
jgi:hypothetical protein